MKIRECHLRIFGPACECIFQGAIKRGYKKHIVLLQRNSLLEASHPLPFTFHRAFDVTRDLDESLDALQALGAQRVLTSGGAPTATEGAEKLARLVRRGGERIVILAGGGVRRDNVGLLVQATKVREVHLRPTSRVESRMRHRSERVQIGRPFTPDVYAWTGTDGGEIEAVVQVVAGVGTLQ